jgi:hypothetical protein
VRLKAKAADLVDEHKVAMVVGRGAQRNGVTVRGVTTDVEVVPHARTDKGADDDVAGILDKSDSNEDGADNIFVVTTAAPGRGIDMCPPVRGEGVDPVEAQLR